MIQKIKSRLSCTEYLSRQGIYVKNGGRTVSPLRPGARNPTSFWVEDDHWYDFGSGCGGDVIDLAAALQYDGDLTSAVRGLANELGIQFSDYTETFKQDIQNLCNRTAAYHAALTPSDYEYLAARGFTPEDAERLMIGRVTDGYLRGRLFLPYFKNGAVVYYATRAMPGSSFQDNKYMKASRDESPSYQHIPWGLQTLTRRSDHDTLIISEGYFDAVSWEREGYPVISPITGNFSKDQWPDVISACRMFSRVLIIFDNDAISHAGDGFTARTAQRLFQHRIPFLVGRTPPGIKDVNDYYTGGGSLETLVSQAEDGLKYITSQYTDPMELQSFIMSINRYTDSTAIAQALFQPILSERFAPAVLKSIQKSADSAPTESQIVDEIIDKHNIIYVDQVGFYEWNGKIWCRSSDSQIKNYADKLYGKRFSTAQRVNAVCNLLKSRTVCSVVFDRNPVLTFQNGTLEIETGKFRDFSEADCCSIIMDYDYDATARCPVWENFIEDVTDEEPRRQEILQFLAGYVLMNDCRFQKIFLLIGSGGNGKSVYLEIIQKLFGDSNVTHVEPTGLAAEFQRIRLKDSLLNIGSDINSDFSRGEIREWLLKVADGTSIQACYKGMNHIDFIPRCKLVYACNAMPTAEIVNGLNRRMQFVDFPCQYVETPDPNNPKQKPRDIDIIKKLDAELPGIFNWAYAGYKLLLQVGYFTDAPEQDDFIQQFEQTSNPVLVFCDDYADQFYGTIDRDEIYAWYKLWCDRTGHKSLSREKFLPKFRDALGDRIIGEPRISKDGVRVRVFKFDTP
jgi:P4 family phage/plasmid primase-like protien